MTTKDPKTGLTARQEKFAATVAMGATQAAAYRLAYEKAATWVAPTVARAGCLLANRPLVKQRVQQLLRAAADANELTIIEVVAMLKQQQAGQHER